MRQEKKTDAFVVASGVSLGISGVGILCVLMVVGMILYGRSNPGSGTAITNEAVLGLIGGMFFTAISWIFGLVGTIMGAVMTIIALVKKRFDKLWIPLLSLVLGVLPLVSAILLLSLMS